MGMNEIKSIEFNSENFELTELAQGVFAAIEKGDNTGSNAGIIDLGEFTIIFDTFLNIDAAEELKKAAQEFTCKDPGFVVNSHSHTDHIIGNCIFPSHVPIISSKKVREMIAVSHKEFQEEKGQYAPRVEEIHNILDKGESSTELADLNNELKFLINLIKPGVEIRVPDMSIESETVLHGTRRKVHLIPYNSAHSTGDIIAYLPDDKICFTGDLLFCEYQPWFGSGNPEQLIGILEGLLRLDIECFVPGHGRLSTKDDVVLQIQYIKEMLQLVNRKNSMNVKDYSLDELSPVFRGWRGLCFSWNINFLIERLNSKGE
jgi:glyoxylase-like metal-dependent hydrolase (beta-lactamase superfamily II)